MDGCETSICIILQRHVQRDASLQEIDQQQTGFHLKRPGDQEYVVEVVTREGNNIH